LKIRQVRGQPRDRRLIKSTLLDYLRSAVPALSSGSARSFHRLFNRKLNQWIEGGRTIDALEDKRPWESGNHRRPAFTDDWKKIRNGAILLDGNERLARQMLHDRGELSAEFCDYYSYEPRANKSDLPRAGSDTITPAVQFALPLRHSERAFKLAGPWTDRDWSGEKPGDWFNADDVTWNHPFKVRNANGSWDVLRGECLLMTDAKSDYPIAVLLIAGHYNSEHVLRLILRAHDEVGLPRKGLILERGVWNGALVKAVGAGPVPLGETVKAFAHTMPGLKIHRSYTPRSKPIEGVFLHLQNRMRCISGFVGFNEQVEKREDIQQLIARARRGDKDALAQFLTQDQWMEQIVSVLDDFRHSPQNGKRIQGLSPAEAWNESSRVYPLPRLTDDTRYLLATHCVEAKISGKGIVVTIRGHRRCYANAHTGEWLARGVDRVLAFYNVEQPELLTVSDLKQQQFFTVKALSLPAMSATREQLAEVAAAKRAHLAPARAIFGDIQHQVLSTIIRDDAHDEPTRELGRFVNDEVEKHKTEQNAEDRKRRKIQREAKAIGASVNGHVQNPDLVLDGIEWEKEIRAELEAQRQAKPGSAGILPANPTQRPAKPQRDSTP